MGLRTLYLQAVPSINGRDSLLGRKLWNEFHEISDEAILGHMVVDDELHQSLEDESLRNDLIPMRLLKKLAPNVIYLERGLFYAPSHWRIPEQTVCSLVQNGAVLIVADVDSDEFEKNSAAYDHARKVFSTFARSCRGDADDRTIYGTDSSSCWLGHHRQIICKPEEMMIDEWLWPVYDGVSEIVVGGPVALEYGVTSFLASGNRQTTGTMRLDLWVDRIDPCPFASVAKFGDGYAVLIAARVSSDIWLKRCPDNVKWLTNVAKFLTKQVEVERAMRISHLRSPHTLFLSHRSTDKGIVGNVARAIEKAGVAVWYDTDKILPSDSFVAAINQGLGSMTHFVLFWSSACVGAPWVEKELMIAIRVATEHNKPLIIIRLDSTPVPLLLSDLHRIEAASKTPHELGQEIAAVVRRLEARDRANDASRAGS